MPLSRTADDFAATCYRLRTEGRSFQQIAAITGRASTACYSAATRGALAVGDDIRNYGTGPRVTMSPATAARAYRLRAGGTDYETIQALLGLRNPRSAYHAASRGAAAAGDDIRRYGNAPATRRRVAAQASDAAAAAVGAAFGRRFGVEIECNGTSRVSVHNAMAAAGLQVNIEGYNHTVRRYWKITTDSSVHSNGGDSMEVVSPILQGAEGKAELAKALEAIRSAGGTVDASCGLHVHHDMGRLDAAVLQRVVCYWHASQDGWFQMVPRRRREANWCRPLSSALVDRVCRDLRHTGTVAHFDRYHALNLASYVRQGTFEVRLHGGTLNTNKVLAWVELFQSLVQAAIDADDQAFAEATTGTALVDAAVTKGLPADRATFLRRRVAALNA